MVIEARIRPEIRTIIDDYNRGHYLRWSVEDRPKPMDREEVARKIREMREGKE